MNNSMTYKYTFSIEWISVYERMIKLQTGNFNSHLSPPGGVKM